MEKKLKISHSLIQKQFKNTAKRIDKEYIKPDF